jgi:hypothetical protein
MVHCPFICYLFSEHITYLHYDIGFDKGSKDHRLTQRETVKNFLGCFCDGLYSQKPYCSYAVPAWFMHTFPWEREGWKLISGVNNASSVEDIKQEVWIKELLEQHSSPRREATEK